MRNALAQALGRDPEMAVVAEGGSADDAVTAAEATCPDVILLDFNMPGGGGLSAAERLARMSPASKVIILTSMDEAHNIDAVLAAGASAYIQKGTPVAEIRQTIRRVLAGKSDLSPSLASRLLSSRPLAAPWSEEAQDLPFDLLEREEQILRRLSQGLTSEEIGESIGLSPATVEAFMTNVMIKLHAAGPGALGL